jgi:hypothetical protein
MLTITNSTECARLACETCGAETTLPSSAAAGRRPWGHCQVCGAWERITSAPVLVLEPAL